MVDRIGPFREHLEDLDADLSDPTGKSSAYFTHVHHTDRGFEYVECQDLNERICSLQQSSLAGCAIPGISAIWLGIDDNDDDPQLFDSGSTRMHLSRPQVKTLVRRLNNWLERGTFLDMDEE